MAMTIREESLGVLGAAVNAGRITAGEVNKVCDFWRERDSYDRNPEKHAVPGFMEREETANEIIKRAYA